MPFAFSSPLNLSLRLLVKRWNFIKLICRRGKWKKNPVRIGEEKKDNMVIQYDKNGAKADQMQQSLTSTFVIATLVHSANILVKKMKCLCFFCFVYSFPFSGNMYIHLKIIKKKQSHFFSFFLFQLRIKRMAGFLFAFKDKNLTWTLLEEPKKKKKM